MKNPIILSLVAIALIATALIAVVFAQEEPRSMEGCGDSIVIPVPDNSSNSPVNTDSSLQKESIPPADHFAVMNGIPVYDQEELLAATDLFALNRHSSYYSRSESGPVFLEKLLSAFPSDAICVQPDGRIYICWDTQLGNRLYLFLEEQDQDVAVTGYPLLVCKALSHDDFKKLVPHTSTLADVARIDPAAEAYAHLLTPSHIDEILKGRSNGHSCSTVHYLTDGILWIQYDLDVGGTPETMTICNWTYDPDYRLSFAHGKKHCYQIADRDLPYGEGGTAPIKGAEGASRMDFSQEDVQKYYKIRLFNEKLDAGLIQVSAEYIQQFKETLAQEGPLEEADLDALDTTDYVKNYLLPSLMMGSMGAGDLREKIPVYKEEALIYQRGNRGFKLGHDYSWFLKEYEYCTSIFGTLQHRPTEAIRKNGDMIYLLYDIDTGYRLCVYWDTEGYCWLDRFAVLLGEKMYWKDFSGLKPGDSFDAVNAIDPRAGIQKDAFLAYWVAPQLEAYHEKGQFFTTIHYLADGLVKIQYEMQKDETFTIAKIEFHDDYMMENAFGVEQSYKLDDRDLPWYEGNK